MDDSTRICTVGNDEQDSENTTLENRRNSPLLALPSEIRNCIYEYAFAHGVIFLMEPSRLALSSRKIPAQGQERLSTFALIHACRQIRHEALPMFCALTTFKLGDFTGWSRMLENIGPDISKAIHSIRVSDLTAFAIGIRTMTSESTNEVKRVFGAGLPSLKQVHVNVASSGSDMYKYYIGKFGKDAVRWSGKDDLVVSIIEY